MSVKNEKLLSVLGGVIHSLVQRNVSKYFMPYKLCHELVMVSIDVMNLGSLARKFQQSFHDFNLPNLLLMAHGECVLESPNVYDITYQVDVIEGIELQEVYERLVLCLLGGKVKV